MCLVWNVGIKVIELLLVLLYSPIQESVRYVMPNHEKFHVSLFISSSCSFFVDVNGSLNTCESQDWINFYINSNTWQVTINFVTDNSQSPSNLYQSYLTQHNLANPTLVKMNCLWKSKQTDYEKNLNKFSHTYTYIDHLF